jgi:hypothetical protein
LVVSVRETRRDAPPLGRQRVEVTVGIHSDDADATHGEGLTVGDIGTFHEFGTQTVPQRSFVRGWFDERQDFIATTLRTQLQQVVAGKRPLDQALERVALAFEGDVKRRITQNIPPPLKPATIARKGSSVALIDTGQLRNSLRGRVKRGV